MSQFPNVALPSFEVDLPSNPSFKYRFRPFLVKEEKLLLMLDANSLSHEVTAITVDLIKRCCLNEAFDFDALTHFDIEFLFLALRARSVGEIQEVTYECNNMIPREGSLEDHAPGSTFETVRCGQKVNVKIDFTKMEIMPNNHTNVITLNGGITLEMRYPTDEVLREFEESMRGDEPPTQTEIYEASLSFVSNLIMKITNQNGAIKRDSDFTQQGCKDWVESLTHQDFVKLQKFVETMPKVVLKVDFNCPKCKFHEEMILEGLQSFFA